MSASPVIPEVVRLKKTLQLACEIMESQHAALSPRARGCNCVIGAPTICDRCMTFKTGMCTTRVIATFTSEEQEFADRTAGDGVSPAAWNVAKATALQLLDELPRPIHHLRPGNPR